jgi:predicted MFS family arabinose efflux permease
MFSRSVTWPIRTTAADAGTASTARAATQTPRLAPLVLATMAAQGLLVVLTPIMVEVAHEFGASVGPVGWARAIAAGSAVAASLVVAGLIHRVGVGRLIACGAMLALVGSATIATAPSLAAFLAAHGVTGIAFACLLSAGLTGVAAFPREQTARVMGYVIGSNALAWIVVSPLSGVLTDALSWRAALSLPAVLALAALAVARLAAPPSAVAGPRPGTGLLGAVSDQRARRWLVAELAAWFAWAAELTYGGAFLIERHAVSEATAGAVFAVAAAAFFLSSVRSAALTARFKRRRLIAASALAMGVLIPLQFNVAPSVWVSLAFLCVIALCSGIRASTSAGLGLVQIPGRPSTMMVAQTAVTQLGYLLGALAGSGMLGSSGYAGLGLVLGVGLLVSALLVTRVADPLQDRGSAAQPSEPTTVIARPAGQSIQAAAEPVG